MFTKANIRKACIGFLIGFIAGSVIVTAMTITSGISIPVWLGCVAGAGIGIIYEFASDGKPARRRSSRRSVK